MLKLEQIAEKNNIQQDNDHEAMGDVIANLGMAKIISEKAPNVWKSS